MRTAFSGFPKIQQTAEAVYDGRGARGTSLKRGVNESFLEAEDR